MQQTVAPKLSHLTFRATPDTSTAQRLGPGCRRITNRSRFARTRCLWCRAGNPNRPNFRHGRRGHRAPGRPPAYARSGTALQNRTNCAAAGPPLNQGPGARAPPLLRPLPSRVHPLPRPGRPLAGLCNFLAVCSDRLWGGRLGGGGRRGVQTGAGARPGGGWARRQAASEGWCRGGCVAGRRRACKASRIWNWQVGWEARSARGWLAQRGACGLASGVCGPSAGEGIWGVAEAPCSGSVGRAFTRM